MTILCRRVYLDQKIEDYHKWYEHWWNRTRSDWIRASFLQESQFANVFEIRHDFLEKKSWWFQKKFWCRREFRFRLKWLERWFVWCVRFIEWRFLVSSQYDYKLLEHHHSNSKSIRSNVHISLLFDHDFESFVDIDLETLANTNFENSIDINIAFEAIARFNWFVEAFSVSSTSHRYERVFDEIERIKISSRRANSYSDRKILRFFIRANVSDIVLEEWVDFIDLKLSSLISSKKARHKVLCLLYHYRHLDETDLTNLSSTDSITHRVTLKSDIRSANNSKQRRWSTHTEWWMRKIVIDEIKDDVYKLAKLANKWLSSWNARAVIIDKVKNSISQDESRVIFDYSRVHEKLSRSFLELSFKIHDNLFDLRHKIFFSIDLKHVYLTISMHLDDRHYFVFFISDIDQI